MSPERHLLKSPSVRIPVKSPFELINPTQPSRYEVISKRTACIFEFSSNIGISEPVCIRSETFLRIEPSLPPGCLSLKSSFENPLRSIKPMVRISPRTSVAVVELVGASPSGQASPLFGRAKTTFPALPSELSEFFVIAIKSKL